MAKRIFDDNLASGNGEFDASWDWKNEYVSRLGEDGYERFSQYSATPDTTAIYAGPARITGTRGGVFMLPIGLVDGINFSSNTQLARLFEIGSNRSFFTRGKTQGGLQFGKMLADQTNIMAALAQASGLYNDAEVNGGRTSGAAGFDDIWMNLDAEALAVPFGVMMVLKTRGGDDDSNGKHLSAIYLESCMLEGYNFGIQSSSPVIMENIGLQYDRVVPVRLRG